MTTTTASTGTPLPEALLRELEGILGERLSIAEAVRRQHGAGESFHGVHAPDAVVFPESTDEVAAIARACSAHDVPMIAFGNGRKQ